MIDLELVDLIDAEALFDHSLKTADWADSSEVQELLTHEISGIVIQTSLQVQPRHNVLTWKEEEEPGKGGGAQGKRDETNGEGK